MTIQFTVKDDELYVIEVSPRAPRKVLFVSNSIGVPLAKLAVKIMVGDEDLGMALCQSPAFNALPKEGDVFFSGNDREKERAVEIAELSFQIHATGGNFKRIEVEGIDVKPHYKLAVEKRPNDIDMMKDGNIDFIINTPSGHEAREDEVEIRSGGVLHKTSYFTNFSVAEASLEPPFTDDRKLRYEGLSLLS